MLRSAPAALAAAFALFAPLAAAAEPDEIGSLIATSAAAAPSIETQTFGQDLRDAWRQARANLTRSWQCVTFARAFSGLQIFGDAWTWWDGAAGKYARGSEPESGAVLVFKRHGSMSRGHVAVVDQVLTERVVQITHANWSPIDGRRGQVEEDVTVVDVSGDNDWSSVKVWYGPIRDLGGSVYPVYGFIYQPAAAGGTGRSSVIAGR